MRSRIVTLFSLSVLISALALLPRAQAASTPIPHGSVDVLTENQSIAPGKPFYLGLHFQLEKGWHIYWINPGDSGQPPRLAWKLPAGVTAGELQWPAPQRLGTSSIVDFGYTDEVTLIVPMRAAQTLSSQQPARIGADLKVLVCREICVPGKAQLSISIPVDAERARPQSETRELFASARKSMPHAAPPNWKFSVSDAKDSFIFNVTSWRRVTDATFFPLDESQIDNAAPQKLMPTANGFDLALRKSDQLLKPIHRLKGVLVIAGNEAYLLDAPIQGAHDAKQN